MSRTIMIFYSLNTANGSATLIGTADAGSLGLAPKSQSKGSFSQRMAEKTPVPKLYTLDPQTGAANFLSSSPSTPNTTVDMAFRDSHLLQALR